MTGQEQLRAMPFDVELASWPFGFRPSVTAPQPGRELRLRGPAGWSNPVFLADPAAPAVLELEPNDAARPQVVAPPCAIAGRFDAPGDVDVEVTSSLVAICALCSHDFVVKRAKASGGCLGTRRRGRAR